MHIKSPGNKGESIHEGPQLKNFPSFQGKPTAGPPETDISDRLARLTILQKAGHAPVIRPF